MPLSDDALPPMGADSPIPDALALEVAISHIERRVQRLKVLDKTLDQRSMPSMMLKTEIASIEFLIRKARGEF